MEQTSLDKIFQQYTETKEIFKDKDVLTIRFAPETVPHREKQIAQMAHILGPTLRGDKPSNVFIYGKTGTGKSLCVSRVTRSLEEASRQNGNMKVIYVNCKMRKVSDTEYRLLSQLISNFGVDVPYTGLPTNQLYQQFFDLLDKEGKNVLLILDEIDTLVNKIGDGVLYNLTRINQDLNNSKVTIIGISNNVSFINELDPRVKSSLSEEEIIFPPYNAVELKNILNERVPLAFYPEVVSPGAVSKCAALAAQEHGDARRALDLLRVAGETAERYNETRILEMHVDQALDKLDTDRTTEIIKTQPKQSQCVFLSILKLSENWTKNIQTGDVFDLYLQLSQRNNLKPLTQRRISDLISELDVFGLLNSKVVSHGRYGRTREIRLNLPKNLIAKLDGYLSKEFYAG
jgi:cell division control protein 6